VGHNQLYERGRGRRLWGARGALWRRGRINTRRNKEGLTSYWKPLTLESFDVNVTRLLALSHRKSLTTLTITFIEYDLLSRRRPSGGPP
jgi:hypothetical protein